MTGLTWRSAFVAAVFAIHPLRVESVAWVSERKDVLSGVFFLLTLGAYTRYCRGRTPTVGRYLWVAIFFALGLMSKPMVVTLPFLLLLLDWWPLKRFSSRDGRSRAVALLREKVPLLLLAVASSVATVFAQKQSLNSLEEVAIGDRVGNAFIACVVYIRQMFLPVSLAPFYPHPGVFSVPEAAGALLLLGAVTAGCVFCIKRFPYLVVGWFWFLGMLTPVIGLVQVGGQSHADRYTYLPQIGLYILVAWLVGDLAARLRYRSAILAGVGGLVLCALAARAYDQTGCWRNSSELWLRTHANVDENYIVQDFFGRALLQNGQIDDAIVAAQKSLRSGPKRALPHACLGAAFLEKGNLSEAIEECKKALELSPNDAVARDNIGIALLRLGRVDEAILEHRKAIECRPNYEKAYNNLGLALLQKGRVDDAMANFEKAIEIRPDYAKAENNLANVLLRKGRLDDAAGHYQKALKIKAEYPEAQANLANTFMQMGKIAEAITHYRKAVELKPDYVKAHANLAGALIKVGHAREALGHLRKALEFQPQYAPAMQSLARLLASAPEDSIRDGRQALELAQRLNGLVGGKNDAVLATLAMAYAEVRQFPEAIDAAQQALKLAEAQSDSAEAEALRRQLALYRSGAPFRNTTATGGK